MKKLTKIFSLLLILILSVATFVIPVAAQNESGLYSVKAILPENQIDSKVTYYDLKMEPGQKQTLQVLVTNTSKEEITIFVSVNNAATNTNGNIMYTVGNIKDESMQYPIESIATVIEEKFNLQPNEEKLVEINLVMPEESFDGVILGGILVQGELAEKDEVDSDEDGILLENKLAYVVGLKLSETENKVNPNINYLGAKAVLYGLSTSIGIELQNSEAIIMKNVSIEAEIYQKNSTNLLHESNSSNVEIAPNSSFNYIVDWEGKAIEPGSYRLKLKVQYEDSVWEWDEEFEITSADSSDVNDGAIIAKTPTPIWLYAILGASGVIVLLLIAFLLGRKSKNNEKK